MDSENNEISNKVTLEPINIKKSQKKRCFHCKKNQLLLQCVNVKITFV